MACLRPGPVLALLFGLGILLGSPEGPLPIAELLSPLPGEPFLRWVAAVLLTILALALSKPHVRIVLIGALTFALGAFRAVLDSDGRDGDLEYPKGMVEIQAWVAEAPVFIPSRIGSGSDETRSPRDLPMVRTIFATSDPELQVSIEGKVPWIAPGQLLDLDGRFLERRTAGNPGDRRPRSQVPSFFVERKENVRAIGYSPFRRPFRDSIQAIRWRALGIIEDLYPEETRGFLLAMILGDRRLLSPEDRRAMARTGTIHFLAVSGLNVGIAMALVIRLPLPRRLRLPARLLFLLAFTVVTGGAPPVVRAAAMLVIQLLGERFGRTPRPLDTLGWATILILAFEPGWAFDIGFQLSLASVFAMAVWCPLLLEGERDPEARLRKRFAAFGKHRRPSAFPIWAAELLSWAGRLSWRSFIVSLAASAGTAPMVFYYFFRIHPLGPFWNLLVAPLVNAILLGGSASIALGSIHPTLGMPAAWAVHHLSTFLLSSLKILEGVPGSFAYLPPPPAWAVVAAQVFLSLGAFRNLRRLALGGTAILAIALGGSSALGDRSPLFQVLDVGGGSSALLAAPPFGSYLFDCGTGGRGGEGGERIARAILASGIRRIDGAFLSHPHADHVGAILELSEILRLERVWVSPLFGSFPEGRRLRTRLGERSIPVEALARGQKILGGSRGNEGLFLEVLHPCSGDPLAPAWTANDGSLVIRALVSGRGILFPGDIGKDGTARLLSQGDDLSSDAVLVPHHGRANPLLPALIERARPGLAILSGNGAVGSELGRRLIEASGIPVRATWEDGAIALRLKDGRLGLEHRDSLR